jgi:hypothetical protein
MRRTMVFSLVAAVAVAGISSPGNAARRGRIAAVSRDRGGVSRGALRRAEVLLPFWDDSFKFAGTTYRYSMIGTSPFASRKRSTTVPARIQPIRVVLSDGTTFGLGRAVSRTATSPLFEPAAFAAGKTQYADAIQRAEFWRYVRGTGYHVLFGGPGTLPALTFRVPRADGAMLTTSHGGRVAAIRIRWFGTRLDELADRFGGGVLPVFETRDVLLYSGRGSPSPSNCCMFGYHTALLGSGDVVHTYVWSSFLSQHVYGSGSGITDVNGLSHEISEWVDDPFGGNVVPNWQSALAPEYGCNPYLEVGDPLVGVSFNVHGYSLQDEAFFSWFAHNVRSYGIHGLYSYLGTFTEPADTC